MCAPLLPPCWCEGDRALEKVRELFQDGDDDIKARALWVLSRMGNGGTEALIAALDEPNGALRAVAFRALRETTPDVLPIATRLASDTSAFVRREVAVSLRDVDYEKAKPLLLQLAKAGGGTDPWYLNAIAAASASHASDFYQSLAEAGTIGGDPLHWNTRTSGFAWQLHPDWLVPDLKTRAGAATVDPSERARALTALSYIKSKQAVAAMLDLTRSAVADVATQARYWVAFRQSNDWFDLIDWEKSGLDPVAEKRKADMSVLSAKVLNDEMPFDERKSSARDMARDEVGAQMLIDLVASGKVPKPLYPTIEKEIFRNPSMSIRMQASHFFTKPGVSRTYSIPAITQLIPNNQQGMLLFNKNCATCHRIGDAGNDIGPELSRIGGKYDQPALLDAIVNPSAGVVFGYEPYLVITNDGDSFYGFLVADGAETVVVKDLAGRRHTIRTSRVQSKKRQENSLMPEPSVFGFSEQDLADLSGYLLTQK